MSSDITSLPTPRHDGWTPERKTSFCETLAETGLVVEACAAVGKSTNTAYAQRRRDPVFAAAWEAALGVARERLADTLLARSIEGTIEQYYRDGELVGEKRVLDSRLGLAILHRLDRIAEQGRTTPAPKAGEDAAPPLPPLDQLLDILKEGDPDRLAALASEIRAAKGSETHEAHDPPILGGSLTAWPTADGWRTNFPPPPDFDGDAHGTWGAPGYERDCTTEESELLEASEDIELDRDRAEAEQRRDTYFAALARKLSIRTGDSSPVALEKRA